MPTFNVNLTEHHHQLIEQLIASGRFQNASEVLRAGLHLLEQQASEENAKLDLLRSLAAKGLEELDQGRGLEFDTRQDLADHIAELGRKAPTSSGREQNG